MEQEGSRRRGAPRSEAEVIFGTRVRRVRELTNMTQAQLADEMRLSVAASKLHLFDISTGRRIAMPARAGLAVTETA